MKPFNTDNSIPNSPKSPPNFWQKSNRALVFATGGAFLGVSLAQIPGAIVLGLAAALYGWLIPTNY
jgi:hypothetical protein